MHDCFSITALLMLEAVGAVKKGHAAEYVLEGHTAPQGVLPTNATGGLIGFGHPTGASGIRMLVDLQRKLRVVSPKKPYGMLVSMGGDDKTTTAVVVKH